jgi:hypothetical protein
MRASSALALGFLANFGIALSRYVEYNEKSGLRQTSSTFAIPTMISLSRHSPDDGLTETETVPIATL